MNNYYLGLRMIADRVGLDPLDIDHTKVRNYIRHEMKTSNTLWFGSPCRFVRGIDLLVHVYLPSAIEEKYPELAVYLRSTSPRWGRNWRNW